MPFGLVVRFWFARVRKFRLVVANCAQRIASANYKAEDSGSVETLRVRDSQAGVFLACERCEIMLSVGYSSCRQLEYIEVLSNCVAAGRAVNFAASNMGDFGEKSLAVDGKISQLRFLLADCRAWLSRRVYSSC